MKYYRCSLLLSRSLLLCDRTKLGEYASIEYVLVDYFTKNFYLSRKNNTLSF
ncbi:MAG: hypothetical protein ACHBN1_09670 [Heteroscytonema crispum UTEX LB 1556]